MSDEKKEKRILGLDLGIASLGWAITKYDTKESRWIIEDFGVRLWNPSEESKTLDSLALERRNFRSRRRLLRRRRQKIADLKKAFINNNLLKESEIEAHFEKINIKDNNYNSELDEINPLHLREYGLENKLTNLQLFIVCYNIIKRRGYENMFSVESEDRKALSDAQKLIEEHTYPIKAIKHLMKNQNNAYRNNSGKDLKKHPNKIVREDILFLREDYKNELEKILDTQVNKQVISDELKKYLLDDVIFRQRTFEDGSTPNGWHKKSEDEKLEYIKNVRKSGKLFYGTYHDTIGNCTFYPDKKRVSYSSIYADLFFIYNELSKITEKLNYELRKKIYLDVIDVYLRKVDFSRTVVKNIFEKNGEKFFVKEAGISFAISNLFLPKIKKLNKDWLNSELEKIDGKFENIKNSNIEKLGDIVSNYQTPKRIVEEIESEGLKTVIFDSKNDLEIIKDIKNNKFKTGKMNVSKEYIIDLTEEIFNNGTMIQKFAYKIQEENSKKYIQQKINNPISNKSNDPLKQAFMPGSVDKDMARNAVVFRSINQIRLVIRALLKKYKHFDAINFEIARDVYASKQERRGIKTDNDKNQKRNLEIAEKLKALGFDDSHRNIEKFKIWEQQKLKVSDEFAFDLYDIELKTKITLDQVLNEAEYQTDHIIPFSIMNDNTIWNKVITSKNLNQSKGNKTPIDYFQSIGKTKKEIDKWKQNIKNFDFFRKNKQRDSVKNKLNYLFADEASRSTEFGFETKDLNDIRYISKYIGLYFEKEFSIYSEVSLFDKPKINSIRGQVTSRLRREWLLNYIDENGKSKINPWGLDDKVREITPFHHSVDAIIISQFENFSQLQFVSFLIDLVKNFRYLKNKIKDNEITILDAKKDLEDTKENFLAFGFSEENKTKFKLTDYQKNKLINLTSYLSENLDLNKKFDLSKIKTFTKPLVENLSNEVVDLVPIKLSFKIEEKEYKIKNFETNEEEIKTKEVKVPIYDSEIYPEEWSKLNNRDKNQFPWPSIKINKRIRGNSLGSLLPIDKKTKKKESEKNNLESNLFLKDDSGNIWDLRKYYGFNLKNFEFLTKYEMQHQKNINTKNILVPGSVFFYEDKYYVYRGKQGENLLSSDILKHYSNDASYNKVFDKWPRIGKNKLKKYSNLKIIDINILGKM